MSSLLDVLQEKLSGKNVRIVLPEGEDERVLTAATKLQATDYVTPLVLGNEEKVNTWIQANVPDYENDQIYQQLKAGAPENIPALVVLSEYASLKWLGINRPDYREVVAKTMDELKSEIIANRDAILGAGGEQQAA